MRDETASHQVGISNSEIQQAYKCELAWLYGFHPALKLQLRKMGPARERGITGHKALEIFYQNLKDDPTDYDYAAEEALNYIQSLRVQELKAGDFVDVDKLDMLNFLHGALEGYFEHYQEDTKNWEILEVEAFHAMEWDGEADFYLPIRLDIAVYHKTGQFKGETSSVDHKLVYDFYSLWEKKMNSQFPLQQKALRASRYKGRPKPVVKRTIVNQIRTRKLKNPTPNDLYRRDVWEYDSQRIDEVFKNHMKKAVRLAWIKRMSLDEAKEEVSASLGSQACKFCDFKEVCDIEFEGGDPTLTIEATLKPSDYGYPALEEIRDERDV